MLTSADFPQGQFQLNRYPLRKNDLLQAWDAADEYLLKYLAEQQPPATARMAIFNDGFGGLAVALHSYQPVAISDSHLSQLATRHNLALNAIDQKHVQLLDSLTVPEGALDYVLIKVPKTLALLEDQLCRIRPCLTADTKIVAAGMVKNLTANVWKLLEKHIGATSTSLAVKKARLIFTTLNSTLPAIPNPYPVCYTLENTQYVICNHANVFSRDSLDIGARFLLQHLPDNDAYQQIIDLGCGNGVIGLMLADKRPNAQIHFVDESHMAMASAKQNFTTAFAGQRQAEFVIDDCLSQFANNTADCIICNPPFHQQHAIGDHIAWQMFKDAHRVLRPGGEFRIIGNRHLQYHQSLKKIFGRVEQVAANGKFVIFKCFKG